MEGTQETRLQQNLEENPGLAAVWTRHLQWVDASAGADQEPRGNDATRWTCPLSGMSLQNAATGEIRDMDCKRWSCLVHGPMLAWRWSQRISGVPWTRMITLTAVPESQAEARKAWTKLIRWLRTRGIVTYLRVMELGHVSGMRHWHVLVDGNQSIPQAELSSYAAQCGLGYVVWISKVRERAGAVWYLLGYVFKSLGVTDERQFRWRKVTVSRNIPNWERVLEKRHDITASTADSGDWSVVSSPNRAMYDAYLDGGGALSPWEDKDGAGRSVLPVAAAG